jgi:hypothetical protein
MAQQCDQASCHAGVTTYSPALRELFPKAPADPPLALTRVVTAGYENDSYVTIHPGTSGAIT